MPFLPVLSLNGSNQRVRLGQGPGNSVPQSLAFGDLPTKPQSGELISTFYANLSDPKVRRDLQHHSAIGAIIPVGSITETWSDLFVPAGLAVTAGSGFALSVSAGVIQSRTFGSQLAVAAATVTPAAPSTYDRTDVVAVTSAGAVAIYQGGPASATATYEVDSVVTSGTPTGGTFTLAFNYNGQEYVTGTIAYNASASTVASAIAAATGGEPLPGTLTGTGGALPTAVTITASGAFEGPITGQRVQANNLTGGTTPSAAFTQTTAGVGASRPTFGGSTTPLAFVYVPSTATSSSNYVITTVALSS